MQVANCTTPANYFHILRRQLKREIRKPLILMTPKSLLRHKRAVSRLDEIGAGQHVPPPACGRCPELHRRRRSSSCPTTRSAASCCAPARSITICSRSARSAASTTSICCASSSSIRSRMKALVPELGRFKRAEVVWCQEEPRNMGGWHFVEPYLEWVLGQVGGESQRPRYAGRPASAATATGLAVKHSHSSRRFSKKRCTSAMWRFGIPLPRTPLRRCGQLATAIRKTIRSGTLP